jgi:S1-C subfamily serine protease
MEGLAPGEAIMKARILVRNRFLCDEPDHFDYALAAIVAALVGLAAAPDPAILRMERAIVVTRADLPSQPEREVNPASTSARRRGISVNQLTAQIARQLGLPSETTGVDVTNVTPGTPAEVGGVERGDVIEEVDGKPTATMDQFQRAIQQAGNEPVLLRINRSGEHLYIFVLGSGETARTNDERLDPRTTE